ncbi:MAG: YbgF trimerization domain-containing protein, partial [Gammaproteobacteria bacterium]
MTFIKANYLLPVLLVLPVCVQSGPPVVEAADGNVSQRLQRLERLVDNQGLLDLYSQIQRLQDQVQKMGGQLEVQRHKLEQLEQQQQALLESSREPTTVSDGTFTDGGFATGISEGAIDGLDADTAGTQTNGSSVATLPDSADPGSAAVNRQIDNARVDEVITPPGGQ